MALSFSECNHFQNRSKKINLNSLSIFIAVFLAYIYSLSFGVPFDEPDFNVRYIEFRSSFYGTLLELLPFNYSENITYCAPVKYLFSSVVNCEMPHFNYFLVKLLIYILHVAFLIIFLRLYEVYKRPDDLLHLKRSFIFLLLMPGLPYFLTLFSPESFYNVFSIILIFEIFTAGRLFVLVPTLMLLCFIDLGNSIVVIIFLISLFLFKSLVENKNSSKILISLIVLLPILSSFRESLLYSLYSSVGWDYLYSLYDKLSNEPESAKYNFIERFIIVIWSSIDYRPSGNNILPIFIFSSFFLANAYIQFYRNRNAFYERYIHLISASFFTISIIISILPQYSFAKYYVFLLLLIYLPVGVIYPINNLLVVAFLGNVLGVIYSLIINI